MLSQTSESTATSTGFAFRRCCLLLPVPISGLLSFHGSTSGAQRSPSNCILQVGPRREAILETELVLVEIVAWREKEAPR